ncbi:MAG: ATP-binding protein, partial [Bacteroidota bacterium]
VLKYEVTDKEIQFIISDNGPGFNHQDLPDPTKPENIEKTHGRGIFLMKHLADEVEFNEKGNEVKISFSLT